VCEGMKEIGITKFTRTLHIEASDLTILDVRCPLLTI